MFSLEYLYLSLNSSPAQVIFYDEMAQSFDQELHDAGQHPVILIISSVKARMIQGSPQKNTFLFIYIFINILSTKCFRWGEVDKLSCDEVFHKSSSWSCGGSERCIEVSKFSYVMHVFVNKCEPIEWYRLANWHLHWCSQMKGTYKRPVLPPSFHHAIPIIQPSYFSYVMYGFVIMFGNFVISNSVFGYGLQARLKTLYYS